MNKILAVGAILLPSLATAGEIDKLPVFSDAIWFHGDIEKGDNDKLLRVLNYRISKHIPTNWLVLDSEGGLVLEAFNMAATIRKNSVKTMVAADAECTSACFILFAAGSARWYWPTSKLGVHSVSVDEKDFDTGSIVSAKVYKFMGVPDGIIGKMVTTSSNDITWLTRQDMEGWANVVVPNLTTEAPKEETTPPAMTMVCSGNKGTYTVSLQGNVLTMNNRRYEITHNFGGAYGSYTVGGPTKYGVYTATFGRSFAHVKYITKGKVVTDACQ